MGYSIKKTGSTSWVVTWDYSSDPYFVSITITTKIGRKNTYYSKTGSASFGGANNEPRSVSVKRNPPPTPPTWTYTLYTKPYNSTDGTTGPTSQSWKDPSGSTEYTITAYPASGKKFLRWVHSSGSRATFIDDKQFLNASATITINFPGSSMSDEFVAYFKDEEEPEPGSGNILYGNSGSILFGGGGMPIYGDKKIPLNN